MDTKTLLGAGAEIVRTGHAKAAKAFAQAKEIQAILMADLRNAETAPSARAQLARAWDALEERKRILRMKPAPKPVDVQKKSRPAAQTLAPAVS